MLDKRDNMYIRLFRHTGYESILEGEITETGVGFVIRKRLSRLGDLFRSSKPDAKNRNDMKTTRNRIRRVLIAVGLLLLGACSRPAASRRVRCSTPG